MNTRPRLLHCLIMILLAATSLGACSSNGTPETPVVQGTVEIAGLTSNAVNTLEDVRRATVLIEATGTFLDPELGMMLNAAGTGSGFIIDPSGLAVTNNHVVTGAALLKVWVDGDDEPRNARIVAVSECSDLAVIDIEGDGYPFLDWHAGEVNVGLEVYSAGFPLGDPEFTLTKGIVSKARADGESSWASVDAVIEHDATINPGNSGGPLVDSSGRVVAINYAESIGSNHQYYAIKGEDAQPILSRLRNGESVDSIGVNAVAVLTDDGSLSGIWISSVASGSAADKAGLKPGDIINTMEGLVLARDGTLADYCDILRTHGTDATLSIEILRYGTGDLLEGQLNGRELRLVESLSGLHGAGLSARSSGGAGYSEYQTVTDDHGILELTIPSSWSDIDGAPWEDDEGNYLSSIWAAPSLDDFFQTWDSPGVMFDALADSSSVGGVQAYLELIGESIRSQCSLVEGDDYEDNIFTGLYELYDECGGSNTSYLVLIAVPIDDPDALIVSLEVQLVYEEDWDALEEILASFNVIGDLPGSATSFSDSGTGGFSEYIWVYDDFNLLRMQVPADWDQIDGTPWYGQDDEIVGARIVAAPDLDGYLSTWDVPGVSFSVSDNYASQVGYLQLLDSFHSTYLEQCEYDGRYNYENPLYRGKYDLFVKCGGSGGPTQYQLAAVAIEDQYNFLIHLEATIVNDTDWDAIDAILNSFEVVGILP